MKNIPQKATRLVSWLRFCMHTRTMETTPERTMAKTGVLYLGCSLAALLKKAPSRAMA